MRYREIIENTEQPDLFKGWFNATHDTMIEVSPHDMHWQAIAADPQAFGVSVTDAQKIEAAAEDGGDDPDGLNALAIANGWVRITNFNDAIWVMAVTDDRGYVQGTTAQGVRKAMLWMQKRNFLPDRMDVQIGAQMKTLDGDNLLRFIERGVLR